MKLSRIKCTIVTMGFLATVLLLTLSTNTYPLPAKKKQGAIIVQNGFYTNKPNILQDGSPHIMLGDIFFTVCTLTPELRPIHTSRKIKPAQWIRMRVEYSDDEYFSIGIYYTMEGGKGKRTMVKWVHHVHPNAKFVISHDAYRVHVVRQH